MTDSTTLAMLCVKAEMRVPAESMDIRIYLTFDGPTRHLGGDAWTTRRLTHVDDWLCATATVQLLAASGCEAAMNAVMGTWRDYLAARFHELFCDDEIMPEITFLGTWRPIAYRALASMNQYVASTPHLRGHCNLIAVRAEERGLAIRLSAWDDALFEIAEEARTDSLGRCLRCGTQCGAFASVCTRCACRKSAKKWQRVI